MAFAFATVAVDMDMHESSNSIDAGGRVMLQTIREIQALRQTTGRLPAQAFPALPDERFLGSRSADASIRMDL